MSKRGQETQGGEERYGFSNGPGGDMADRPQQANAAQMARRKIAQVKKAGASARSSRANTPTGNPFAPQQQSMPSFQMPQQGGGDGGGFNFSVNAASNPFQNVNGASGTPPPSFGMNQPSQQQNGGAGMFGNNNTSFGSTFGSSAPAQPQSNGFSFGSNNTNGNNTPSFGGFGQSNQNQSQQNGATPGSNTPSLSFGQTNGNAKTPFQFGQSQPQTQSTQGNSFSFGQQPQTNGDKPATSSFGGFGQNAQQPAGEKTSTPSFSFGQSTQQNAEKPATPSFGLFGQNSAAPSQTNGDKPSLFGAAQQANETPKPSTGSLFTFGSSNKGIGGKPATEATPKPAEASKPPMSNLFGAQQNTGPGLFGSTPPPRESSATPKPGESIFSTQSKPKLGGNLFTSDMAEGQKPESSAPSFEQPAQQNGADADQTPKPKNIFGGLGQSQAPAVQDTPRPSSNLFSASSFGQTPAQPATASRSLFNQSTQDTSMNSPGKTPQKSSPFAPAASKQADAPSEQPTANETPAPGRSLFDRISRPEETLGQQDSSFGQRAATPNQSSAERLDAPATIQKSLFSPSTSTFNAPSPQPSSSGNLFSKQSERPTTQVAPQTSSSSSRASTSQLESSAQPARATTSQKTSSQVDVIPEDEKGTLKVLNEGLLAHLSTQDASADWATIMEYYLQQAAIIRHKPAPNLTALSAAPSTSSATAQSPETSAPSPRASAAGGTAPTNKPTPSAQPQSNTSSAFASQNVFGSSAATPKAPAMFQRTSSSDSQQTPRASFTQPPSTAPVNRKRSAEEEPERPPATEKRARASDSIEYPKLPENASDVSKVFFNALENKSAGSSMFAQNSSGSGSGGAASAEKDKPQEAPAPSGFKPSTSGFTPNTSGFKPATSGFAPSMPSSGSNNFLAAFGKRASEQQEKDRKKRRDEDYDSEEETEEQWAERDRKAQEEKRLKALEDAKAGSGFVFKPTSKPAEQEKEKDVSKDSAEKQKDSETDDSAESGQSKSLFDRISVPAATTSTETPSLFSSQTAGSKTPTSNLFGSSATPAKFSTGSSLFGHLSKPAAQSDADKGETIEKQTQGSGDNTWKPSTPIKFGTTGNAETTSTTPAAAPPSFGNLFGTKAQASSSSNGLLNVPSAKPALGFNFGTQPSSAGGSRATTPGVTTDGEGTGASTAGDADNEPSDDPPASEAQVEDMTGLSAEETKDETLLFSVAMSKASKWDEKKTDEGGMAHGWVDKGKGPLYLLQNDETGKVRILLKVPPYGAAKMNFPPLKGGGYEVQGKTGKQITGTFYDHMSEKPGLGKWLIAVGKKEDAEEIGRILRENMPE